MARPTGPKVAGTSRGFTLIEIMVVVLIMGILATMVTLSIGGRSIDQSVQVEAERLQQLLRLALEDAEAKGVQIGFRYTTEGYEFLAIDASGQWQPAEDRLLRARALKAPFKMLLRVESRPVAPAVPHEFAPEAPVEPQLLLLSSGEVTPFLMWISAEREPDSGYLVEGQLTGEIGLQRWSREAWDEKQGKKT